MSEVSYTVIDNVDIQPAYWDIVYQCNEDDGARQNIALDKTILSWNGSTPQFVTDLSLTIYDLVGIRTYLLDNASEWDNDD